MQAPAPPPPPIVRAPDCPRCGYDLSGAVAAWNDHCPLEGVCPECGLRFEWRRIVRGLPLAWLFECPGEQSAWRRLLTTALRAIRPSRLWSTLDLATPLHPRRLVAFWILAILIFLLLAAPVTIACKWYRLGWMNYAGSFIDLSRTPGSRTRDYLRLLTMVLPFNSRPAGILGLAIDSIVYIHLFIAAALALGAIVPLLLSETFGKARIRRIHALRAAAYSAPLGFLAATVTLLLGSAVSPLAVRFGWPPFVPAACYLAVAGMFSTWWWRCFAFHYLRIPHAWGVGLCATAVGSIATLVIFLQLR